jgi:small subunit ribosomal protein S18
MAKKAPRTKNKDNARRSKKKTSVLVQESVEYIDFKDVNLLRRFMSDRAKIRARRVTGNDAQQQREVARAIKNAREMALLPYTNRVTTQRTSRDRGPGGPGRAEGPPPRPAGPPPMTAGDGLTDEMPELDTELLDTELLDDVLLDDGFDEGDER